MRVPRSRVPVALAALVALALAAGTAVSAATGAPDVSAALLVADDLPTALSPSGVTHEPAFEFDSASFDASGGLDKAEQIWQAAEVLPDMHVAVVFDFRFLFPDADAAQAYLDAAEPIHLGIRHRDHAPAGHTPGG